MSPIRYELLTEASAGIARITLARPEARNAQSVELLYALNDAFDAAAQDDSVKVIILDADGPHFSAGHDLRDRGTPADFQAVGTWCGFELPGHEGYFAREEEIYLGMCRRWRDLPKPTIAAVQGRCIAGGLMLAWVCDIILAAEDAVFSDPVVGMGVNGVEWFAHPYEMGARKAKELLFTADSWSAAEAREMGMVNRVVPAADLDETALVMARKIAAKPSFALKLAKLSVNQALDAGGQKIAIDAAFGLHHVAHAHNKERFGMLVDPSGLALPTKPATPSQQAEQQAQQQ
jgi:enoyl-CoA hydratase